MLATRHSAFGNYLILKLHSSMYTHDPFSPHSTSTLSQECQMNTVVYYGYQNITTLYIYIECTEAI